MNLLKLFFAFCFCQGILLADDLRFDISQVNGSAIPLTKYFYILEDRESKLKLEDILLGQNQSSFHLSEKKEGNINLGLSESSHWLKLNLENKDVKNKEMILELHYARIAAEIEVFIPDDAGKYSKIETGFMKPYSSRIYKHRYYVFPLHFLSNSSKTIYMKFKSSRIISFPARIWFDKDFYQYEKKDYMTHSIYFGIVFSMFVFNLLLYIGLKDINYLLYISFVSSIALTLAADNGLAGEFIWGEFPFWTSVANMVGFPISIATFLIFMRRMLGTKGIVPRTDKLLKIFIILLFISPIFVFYSYAMAYKPIVILMGTTAFIILITGIYCSVKGGRSALFFIIAFFVLAFFGLANALSALRILPVGILESAGMQLGSAIEMLLLAFALSDRYNILRLEKEKAQVKALKVEQELVETLKTSEKILEQKVKERTSELNNTLNIIKQDLHVAHNIQMNTVKIAPSILKELTIYSYYHPMTEVGGDFFDVIKLKESYYRIFIADATGHGVQAAMITMAIKGLYDNIKIFELDPGSLLSILNNEYIKRYYSLKSFFTCSIVDIDLKNNKLLYAAAGHPPIVFFKDSKMLLLKERGKLIGVLENLEYKFSEIEIKNGDRLFLYTDGATEEFNSLNEEYGEDRLYLNLEANINKPLQDVIEIVMSDLNSFLGVVEKQDDITFIGIEYQN